MASPKDKHFNVAAFLKSVGPSEVIDFYGIEVPVPTDTPLSYTLRAQEIQDSSAEDPSNVLRLLADVLGEEIAEKIKKKDPGIRAIGALLLWAYQNASGEEMSFEDAYYKYLEQEKSAREEGSEEESSESGGEGKANLKAVKDEPNRSTRRAATRSGRKSTSTSA